MKQGQLGQTPSWTEKMQVITKLLIILVGQMTIADDFLNVLSEQLRAYQIICKGLLFA